MDDHVHMGILFIFSVAAAVAVTNVTVRTIALHNSSKPWAKALTYVYG